jgi:hypothetical protein
MSTKVVAKNMQSNGGYLNGGSSAVCTTHLILVPKG